MKTQPMVSLKAHKYGRKTFKKGDPFSADPRDVKLLKNLGRAQISEDAQMSLINPPAVDTKVQTRALDAEDAEPDAPATRRRNPTAQRNRGRYSRRDLRAKD